MEASTIDNLSFCSAVIDVILLATFVSKLSISNEFVAVVTCKKPISTFTSSILSWIVIKLASIAVIVPFWVFIAEVFAVTDDVSPDIELVLLLTYVCKEVILFVFV